jgi:Spy/CpxP family protein refolding chaperone
MKNILKISLLAITLIVAKFSPVSAQTAPQPNAEKMASMTPEERTEKRTELLKSKLLLSKDQTDKVRDAIYKLESQRGADKNEMKLNREAFDNEMVSILDPEQLEKYRALQQERKEQMKKAQQEKESKAKIQSTEEDKTN